LLEGSEARAQYVGELEVRAFGQLRDRRKHGDRRAPLPVAERTQAPERLDLFAQLLRQRQVLAVSERDEPAARRRGSLEELGEGEDAPIVDLELGVDGEPVRLAGDANTQRAHVAYDRRAQCISRRPFDDDLVAPLRFELEEELETGLDVGRDAIVTVHGKRGQEGTLVEQTLRTRAFGREIALNGTGPAIARDEKMRGLGARSQRGPFGSARHDAEAHAKRATGAKDLDA
jgi:hypothetical protein